jgi:hypothetical protein
MQVCNVHERLFPLPSALVGALIDSLASRDDRLWPRDKWPPMRFDRPLAVGAAGGHGPIRYFVEEYRPGQSVLFRFSAPRGFNGTHCFEVEDRQGTTVLRHVLEMRAAGRAVLRWLLYIRPLHDACIEDCLDRATLSLRIALERPARWSIYVRLLRAVRQAVSSSKRR